MTCDLWPWCMRHKICTIFMNKQYSLHLHLQWLTIRGYDWYMIVSIHDTNANPWPGSYEPDSTHGGLYWRWGSYHSQLCTSSQHCALRKYRVEHFIDYYSQSPYNSAYSLWHQCLCDWKLLLISWQLICYTCIVCMHTHPDCCPGNSPPPLCQSISSPLH